ncbi:hypothetical protein [Catellatospora chokoriensis]|uniref:hypothetical protein n=1 Tax=Catellatospora chokoriensis TaxID=310353 RepID=UPI00177F2E80|nr:hypothetical protein [Catellatospora chokoriensis]
MGRLALLWFAGTALAFGVPAYLVSLWRVLPAVWRGELRRTPVEDFRLFAVSRAVT